MKCNWLLLALLATSLPVAAGEMYSWTDANGTKHFSDSPPPASVKAQKVKMKGGVTSNEPAEQQQPADKNAGPALAAAAGYAPEDIKRNCAIARQNLGVAEGRKIPVDAQGYPTDLDAAKARQQEIDRANGQIKLFCSH
ncbi:DUF4124 domain-containing protein [Dokdonella fugitiva]|jgi:hypothetical protein|uniref:Uncharacterized protein DUF4124 n=1 Tax=Dokdonella fugitiva TaxID=328517 RepID=A0A4R2IEW6_9GAMM|nr:DUF4124 domain-containing protein [Dokdonella fugitiva]MBA8882445.1 hypothetical protein [Dokdonella fugitiva]TCO42756.1 uncharacterized protein DUF4124 [Dokdonella fugitiva]